MKRILKSIYMAALIILLISVVVSSCSEDPLNQTRKRTLVVYMVATNSLSGYEELDFKEIEKGAMLCDLERNSVLVYLCSINNPPTLYEIGKESGAIKRKVLKQYTDDDVSSVDPARVSEVISDARSLREAESYGIVFWSHGTGWLPEETSGKSAVKDYAIGLHPMNFGPDYRNYIDIDQLASAIPSGVFSFIWMDCCYMGAIEVAYQFRDKCRYFVGYPTEVLGTGIPYDCTLPFLMSDDFSIEAAAQSMFDYYDSQKVSNMRSCTISVTDMLKIEELATITRDLVSDDINMSASGLQCYSRRISPAFYDFRQYVQRMGQLTGNIGKIPVFEQLLDECVVYKAATPFFLTLKIDPTLYSGLSVHLYNRNEDTLADKYYWELDWFKNVYD